MPSRLTSITPVLLGVASAEIALGLLTPLIPLMMVAAGARSGTIGLVASAYYVGFLCGTLSADRIVESVGHSRAFVVFAALAADSALMMGFFTSPLAWAVARLVMGYQMAGLFLVAESWLNDKADRTTRGRIFGAYLVVSWGASAIGPLALNVVAASALLFSVVGIAFATALLPMALTHVANPTLGRHRRFGLAALYRVSPLGLVCCLAAGLVNSAFYGLVPVYLRQVGHGPGTVAAFISATLVVTLVVQYPVGHLADRIGRRPLMLGALGLGFGFAVLLGLAEHAHILVLTVAGCLYAGVTAPLYGLGAGQMNDHIDPADRLAASGGLLFAWALGASAGPGTAGFVMARLGYGGLFVYLAGVIALLVAFTILRSLLRAGVSPMRQTGYVPMPAAPPSVAGFAPAAPARSSNPAAHTGGTDAQPAQDPGLAG